MNFNLSAVRNGIIVGAGHGIGFALVKLIIETYENINLVASYRQESQAQGLLDLAQKYQNRLWAVPMDPSQDEQVKDFAMGFGQKYHKAHLLINCIGFLHDQNFKPEKSLDSISSEQMLKSFHINSVITALLARFFLPYFRHKDSSCFCALSAMVGSIEDNALGGWYSYRASKAALNMIVKNMALEYQRRGTKTVVLAVHPGTTKTDLSRPFLSHVKHQIHEPLGSAKNILQVISGKSPDDSGLFYNWDNSRIPW